MPRNLLLVLGDQLNEASAAFDGFDPAVDAVWMAEVAEESEHVWTHKARIAVFLSAMRHFRERLRERGISVDYRELRPSKAACPEIFTGTAYRCPRTFQPSRIRPPM